MWRKSKLLGSGTYGKVFLATPMDDYHHNLPLMAVKSTADKNTLGSLQFEGNFLKQLDGQPNIVQCFGEDFSLEDGRWVYNLLLEFAPGGSLRDQIRKTYHSRRSLSEFDVACYASMLLRGLAAIHAQGIVHCDLKPANILAFPLPVRGGIGCLLKIADLGVARRVSENEKIRVWDGKNTHNRGSLLYSSPESVAHGLHGTCTDIWSLGCIVVEMITGKRMWRCRDSEVSNQILRGKLWIPRGLSEDGKDFLKRCLEIDPQKRWSADELLYHPFIVENLILLKSRYGVDLSKEGKHFGKNPFGMNGWVSKRHLFSTAGQRNYTNSRKETKRKREWRG